MAAQSEPAAQNEEVRLSLEREEQLGAIFKRLAKAPSLQDILWVLEQDVRGLLQADRLTLYRLDPSGREIISWYRSAEDSVGEIRVPISPTSIAGYVAMSQQPLKVDDVYDEEALKAVHPSLRFDSSYDQNSGYLTESMVVVPIKYKETLLGVLQVINKAEGGAFSDQDVIMALAVAQILGDRFRHELKSTTGPFEYLIQSKRVSMEKFEELEQMAAAENKSLVRLLEKHCKLTVEEIGESLEHYYQVPFMPYDEKLKPDPAMLQRLNVGYLARNLWVPFVTAKGDILLLVDDPNDTDRIMDAQQLINAAANYEIRVGIKEDILRYLGIEVAQEEEQEVNLDDIVGKIEAEAKVQEAKPTAEQGEQAGDEEELDENASPIVQLVNRLVVEAVESNASDIHIEPYKGKTPAMVRMRVDGVCRPVLQIPYTHIRAVVSRIKVLSRIDIAERRLPQDGKMTVKVNGNPIELRVATVPTVCGESAVLRILAAGEPLPFEKLNFSPRNLEICNRLLAHPHGIFLVVGPTGSGKTTTLHGLLGYINKPDTKILTAEDPVEITQNGLQQVQVQSDIGLTFARCLRAFLRADPDVILIGEMRDQETAHAGIEASLTGHLVFSTLHTNSAPETITRLLDMGLDPLNFADAVIGVLAQRLVRTLCSQCKESYTPDAELTKRLIHFYGEEYWPELKLDPGAIKVCKPKGCPRCGNSGYKGRTGVHELLEATAPMKKLISSKGTVSAIRELALKEGMRTVMQDGVLKILKGQIDVEQLLEVTVE